MDIKLIRNRAKLDELDPRRVRRTELRFESKPKKSENRPIAAAYQTHLILRSNISSRRGERKNIHCYSKKCLIYQKTTDQPFQLGPRPIFCRILKFIICKKILIWSFLSACNINLSHWVMISLNGRNHVWMLVFRNSL